MKRPFPPRMLAYDNETEGEAELIRAELDLFTTMSKRSGLPIPVCRQIFVDELAQFPPRAICSAAKQSPPPHRFGWKVLGMLALAFGLAMLCAYLGLNGEGF